MLYEFLIVFALALFAGLATGIGGAISFFTGRHNNALLAVALGFSGGVMIYISMVELLGDSISFFTSKSAHGAIFANIAFFAGILLALLIDRSIPSDENPHEFQHVSMNQNQFNADPAHKKHGAWMIALAITIHNFPEGLAVVGAGMKSLQLGIPIALAIAVHNIPEGMAVSLPLYYATGNKKRAFLGALLSGLAEPLGAIVGFLLLRPFLNDSVLHALFAAVAGIMVYITFDELLPLAETTGEHHKAIYGLLAGMFFMAATLILFIH
ncbi:MAG: zinc transporter ZupT [Victivallaceae bacterium]|nr:zinc transporter ZupT [Victivallaceae bacterium]